MEPLNIIVPIIKNKRMLDLGIKYIVRELSVDEKKLFLSSVNDNETLKKELVDYQHLIAYLSLQRRNEDKINTAKKLVLLMKEIDNNKR